MARLRWVGGSRLPVSVRCLGVLAGALAAGACELQEITLAESEDLPIAEVFVQVRPTATELSAFIHRTEDGSREGDLTEADVRITGRDGRVFRLSEQLVEECLVESDDDGNPPLLGTCYGARVITNRPLPGDTLRLDIETDRGERMSSVTVIPEGFVITSPSPRTCGLEPFTTWQMTWTQSDGAWAYVAESLISGLSDAAPDGVEVDDPLNLIGVSISAADTTITFPSEFGVFDRFDLDRELSLLLQQGLPEGTSSGVVVGALDRNWVNWVRGGDFNPSGQTRIPSVLGDGTGVFGSVVRQTARFEVPGVGLPPCTG